MVGSDLQACVASQCARTLLGACACGVVSMKVRLQAVCDYKVRGDFECYLGKKVMGLGSLGFSFCCRMGFRAFATFHR